LIGIDSGTLELGSLGVLSSIPNKSLNVLGKLDRRIFLNPRQRDKVIIGTRKYPATCPREVWNNPKKATDFIKNPCRGSCNKNMAKLA